LLRAMVHVARMAARSFWSETRQRRRIAQRRVFDGFRGMQKTATVVA